MSSIKKLSKILRTDEAVLLDMDKKMEEKTKRIGVLDKVVKENEGRIEMTLDKLNIKERDAFKIRNILRETIIAHEKQLLNFLENTKDKDEFEKAANLSRKIAKVGKGFFLKKEYAKEILRKRPPANLLKYLNLKNTEELLEKIDITEAFSALRFIESDQWMHQTFKEAYSGFTAADFEEREIEIKVLGPEWQDIAKKFVEKKHHNVSHLKEFGVIFINPIKIEIPGKFLRDFALLLHYFHEIEFYSKLFRKYSNKENFAERLKSLLRGDVIENWKLKIGNWIIIQRYLWKEDPDDPRLKLPRVNPEAIHWAKGERDLTEFGKKECDIDLELWEDMDWVGDFFGEEFASFDLEDNAMSEVSFREGKKEYFNYHHQEALWTKIFTEYVGGEKEAEKLLIENFDKGIIELK